jgi:hypothetical protein
MTDEQKEKRRIGSISEYKTLGSKHAKVQTSTSSDMQMSTSLDGRKSKHPDWVQQTAYIPRDLAKWVRVFAVQSEMEVSEIVAQALREFREKHK